MYRYHIIYGLIVFGLVLSACVPVAPAIPPTPTATFTAIPTATATLKPTVTPSPTPVPVYLDPAFSVEERVADILGRMSVEEKIGQLLWARQEGLTDGQVEGYGLGGVIVSSVEGVPAVKGLTSSRVPLFIAASQAVPQQVRAPLEFPSLNGLMSARNRELTIHAASYEGQMLAEAGFNAVLGVPVYRGGTTTWQQSNSANITRAYDKGLRSVLFSAPLLSFEDMGAVVAEEELLSFGPASQLIYQLIDESHPAVIVPDGEGAAVLIEWMRSKMAYRGLVILEEPADPSAAFISGADVLLLSEDVEGAYLKINAAVTAGEISQERLDESASRVLASKFSQGLFDGNPGGIIDLDLPFLRSAANEAAAGSLVLLKNQNQALPLSRQETVILAAGWAANDLSAQGAGLNETYLAENMPHTLLGALQAEVGQTVRVEFDPPGLFANLQLEGKTGWGVAVISQAAGQAQLSFEDLDMLQNLRSRVEKLVVVVYADSAWGIEPALQLADGVVIAWRPGSEMSGVAEVLFGKAEFTGNLPFNWQLASAESRVNLPDGFNASADDYQPPENNPPNSADEFNYWLHFPLVVQSVDWQDWDSTGWNLVWQDEFNGSALDFSKWNYYVVGPGEDNNELQSYTSRVENIFVENGRLVIQALKEEYNNGDYTSGRINTLGKGDWLYGRVDVRARLPYGRGIWPAIWMMPSDDAYGEWAASGEIDIMELLGNEPNKIYATLHYGGVRPNNDRSGGATVLNAGTFADDYHIFSLEWEPTVLRWYLDGRLYHTETNWYSSEQPFPAPFDKRFYIILNVAVVGDWPGSPDTSTEFPQRMEVDYVRVYQRPFTKAANEP